MNLVSTYKYNEELWICGNESRIIAKHLQVVVGYTISKGVREGWRVKFDHSGSRVWKVQHSFARHIPLLYISKKESALHPKVQFVRPYPNFPGAVKRNCPVIPLILISMYDFTCQAWDTNLRESFGIVLDELYPTAGKKNLKIPEKWSDPVTMSYFYTQTFPCGINLE